MPEQLIVNTPENWDAASQGYAEKIAPLMMQPFAEEFIDRLDVDVNTEALEVAAGSGALTATLAKRVKSLLVTDFSPKMIEVVESKMQSIGATNVTFAVMDGQNLELDDNLMDRAACCFGLMLFQDRHKGFRELNRVVRPGGKVMVSGWAGPDRFETFALFLASLQKAFPDFPEPDAPPPVFSLADPGRFKSDMENAGFRNVNVAYVEREVMVPDFDKLWTMLTVGAPPSKLLFDKIGPEGKNKVHDALAEIVRERFGNGPISLTNTATVGVGAVA
jgi:SAM-dependent methyltransferase